MYGETTIGYYGGWAVKIVAMIFNDRLVLSDESPFGGPRYGWCFPKGGAAHLAAMAWDPEIEGGRPATLRRSLAGEPRVSVHRGGIHRWRSRRQLALPRSVTRDSLTVNLLWWEVKGRPPHTALEALR